jgi:hypothetical protein
MAATATGYGDDSLRVSCASRGSQAHRPILVPNRRSDCYTGKSAPETRMRDRPAGARDAAGRGGTAKLAWTVADPIVFRDSRVRMRLEPVHMEWRMLSDVDTGVPDFHHLTGPLESRIRQNQRNSRRDSHALPGSALSGACRSGRRMAIACEHVQSRLHE